MGIAETVVAGEVIASLRRYVRHLAEADFLGILDGLGALRQFTHPVESVAVAAFAVATKHRGE